MSERLRVGVVGCGSHATIAIWPSLRFAPVDVAWACDLDRERAATAAAAFGARRATTDAGDLLGDDDLDAVFVVGPPDVQGELALRAAEAGKHVFVEKPPGTTLDQACAIERAAAAAGVHVMVGFMKRWARAYRLARDIVRRDEFGGVRLLRVDYTHWPLYDVRDHLLYMSVHALDLARFFLGDVDGGSVHKHEQEDGLRTLAVTLRHAGAATSMLNLSSLDPHVQEHVSLSGASTLVTVRNLVELRSYARGADLAELDEGMAQLWHPNFGLPDPAHQHDSLVFLGYAGEVREFAEAVLAGRAPEPSIADGVAAMRLVEGIAAAPEGTSRLAL